MGFKELFLLITLIAKMSFSFQMWDLKKAYPNTMFEFKKGFSFQMWDLKCVVRVYFVILFCVLAFKCGI